MDEELMARLFESLGRIEAKQDSLRVELLGEGGRIVSLEKEMAWNSKKDWLHTAVVIPFITGLHLLLRHIKVNI